MEPPPAPPQSPPSSPLRRLINFDTSLSLRIYTLTNPILPYYFLKSLEISGDGRLFFPLILSLILYPFTTTPAPTTSPFLLNLLLGGLLDILVIGLLKHLIRRPRPIYNKNMFLSFAVDHWSFPSGHCSRVSFVAGAFYLYSDWVQDFLINKGFSHLLVENFLPIVASWAVITSVSRVLLGRHFVFDVIVGMFLGVLESLFVFRFLNYQNFISFF